MGIEEIVAIGTPITIFLIVIIELIMVKYSNDK